MQAPTVSLFRSEMLVGFTTPSYPSSRAWFGVTVRPPDAGPEESLTVLLAVPVALLWVTVACWVVYVVDEPERFGFAYGTLPHHVIEGEESFVVERDGAGRCGS